MGEYKAGVTPILGAFKTSSENQPRKRRRDGVVTVALRTRCSFSNHRFYSKSPQCKDIISSPVTTYLSPTISSSFDSFVNGQEGTFELWGMKKTIERRFPDDDTFTKIRGTKKNNNKKPFICPRGPGVVFRSRRLRLGPRSTSPPAHFVPLD